MARPVGGRLSETFRDAYLAAKLTQNDVVAGLHARGFTNVDQPLVSKWARGMRVIPLEVLPALDEILGEHRGYLLRRAGYVEDGPADVESAILSHPTLSDERKLTLVDAYRGLAKLAPTSR